MSKIQKALGQFRADGPDTVVVAKGETHKRSNAGRSGRVKQKKYSIPGEGYVETRPLHSMEVDLDNLVECGLQLRGSDFDGVAQQFRRIKRPVLNMAFGDLGKQMENANVIMVASALPKSGKSFCSYNLALSISRERDVGAVLVDADVLKPNISRAFDVEDRIGLIDYLLDPDMTLEDILIDTDLQGIVVVPAGQRHEEATELLASRRMEQFVHELSERFQARLVIVDTPPLLLTNEAHVLSEHMGQIVFEIEAGETTQESLSTALEMLDRDKPINGIMNKTRGPYGGGYAEGPGGGYYGYYQSVGERGDADG